MSTWIKALLGIGIGATAVIIVKKVVVDKKYATVSKTNEESDSLLKRLKKAAEDKVAGILMWFANHPKEAQIASVVISVLPVVVGMVCDLDLLMTNRRIDKRLSNLETDYYLAGVKDGKYAAMHQAIDGTEVAG